MPGDFISLPVIFIFKYNMKNIFLLFLFITTSAFGQLSRIDSLENSLSNHKYDDEEKVNLLNEISYLSYRIDIDKTKRYALEALSISEKLHYREGLAESYRCIGIVSLFTGKNDDAIRDLKISLDIFKNIGDELGMAKALGNIGVAYAFQGDFNSALNYYFDVLEILNGKNETQREAITLNNIGEIHMKMQNYNEALKYFEKQFPMFIATNDSTHILTTYTNLADCNRFLGNLDKASGYCTTGITIAETGGFTPYLCGLYTIKGQIDYKIGNKYSAYNSLVKATRYSDNSADIEFKWKPYVALAEYYQADSNYIMAQINFERALDISQSNNLSEGIREATKGLHTTAAANNNFNKAYEYLLMNKQFSDSLLNESNIKKFTILEMQHEYDIQQHEQKLEQERQKLISNFFIISFGLVLLIIIVILRDYKAKTKINKQLLLANATKDKFIAIIAHDLKNPIHSMLGSSDLLLKDYPHLSESERMQLVEGFQKNVKNINSLLTNLLTWANSQRGNIEINKEVLPLQRLVKDSISPYEINAVNKSIAIEISLNADLNIYCDKNTIGTVISNLVNNAIKFTPKNGRIKISASRSTQYTQIEIEDNGTGLDEKAIDELFRIDKHFSTKGTNNESGTGLGLIISKEFIDLNGGDIWVESSPGIGSKFIFTLPNK